MEFFSDGKMQPPDDLHIVYEDEYDQPQEEFEYDYEDFLYSQMTPSFNDIVQHCLIPTIESVNGQVGKLIFCGIIFRIFTRLSKFSIKYSTCTSGPALEQFLFNAQWSNEIVRGLLKSDIFLCIFLNLLVLKVRNLRFCRFLLL